MKKFSHRKRKHRVLIRSLVIALVVTCGYLAYSLKTDCPQLNRLFRQSQITVSPSQDTIIAQAFRNHTSNIVVESSGIVEKILTDDLVGSRHQRFIVRLSSGQTLLISHNIDLATRIDEIEVGDEVKFRGEYEWNNKGGIIHWTHRDPKGRRPGGWIKHNGKRYR